MFRNVHDLGVHAQGVISQKGSIFRENPYSEGSMIKVPCLGGVYSLGTDRQLGPHLGLLCPEKYIFIVYTC